MTKKTTTTTKKTSVSPLVKEEVKDGNELEQQNSSLVMENEELRMLNKRLEQALSASTEKIPYLVVIPYKESAAQGKELLLAVKGWIKHFQEDFKILIIGNVSDQSVFSNLENKRCKELMFLDFDSETDDPQLDVTRKFLRVIERFPEYDGFIVTNDDIYPVNDFDIVDVKQLKCDGLLSEQKKCGGIYASKRNETYTILRDKNLPVFDYACHLPVYFNSERLLEVVECFDCKNKGLLLSSLYFNFVYPNRIPLRLDMGYDNLKVSVARQNANLVKLKELIPQKIWVNNSPVGWSLELESIIEKRLCGKK